MGRCAARRAFIQITALLISAILLLSAISFGEQPLSASGESVVSEGDFTYDIIGDGTSVTVTGYTGESLTVTIPGTIAGLPVKAIGKRAFDGKYTLTSVTLPDGLELIDSYAFRSCAGLTAIVLPETVKKIGESAFYNCQKLADITIGRRTYDVGYLSFHNTAWYNRHVGGPIYLGRVFYAYKGAIPKNTELTIAPGTASVTAFALSGYANLKAVYLPVGIKAIGSWAFKQSASLLDVRIPSTIENINANAFDGCPLITVSGAKGSYAQTFCTEQDLHFKRDTTLEFLFCDLDGSDSLSTLDLRLLLLGVLDDARIGNIDRFMSCDQNDDGRIDTDDARRILAGLVK